MNHNLLGIIVVISIFVFIGIMKSIDIEPKEARQPTFDPPIGGVKILQFGRIIDNPWAYPGSAMFTKNPSVVPHVMSKYISEEEYYGIYR